MTNPLIRTSQVSLSSNPDADFRYSSILTQVGIYKGRVLAVKKINKKSVDISRKMKKELKLVSNFKACFKFKRFFVDHLCPRNRFFKAHLKKKNFLLFQVRDLRHDNLNSFIGACIDPPNVCIVTEYCTRGSLKVNWLTKIWWYCWQKKNCEYIKIRIKFLNLSLSLDVNSYFELL